MSATHCRENPSIRRAWFTVVLAALFAVTQCSAEALTSGRLPEFLRASGISADGGAEQLLSEVCQSRSHPRPEAELVALADALIRSGVRVDLLTTISTARLTAATFDTGIDAKFNGYYRRIQISSAMWTLATSSFENDREKATRLAKAVVALGLNDRFMLHPGLFELAQHEALLMSVMNRVEAEAMQASIAELARAGRAHASGVVVYAPMIDGWIASRSIDLRELDQVLRWLEDSWEATDFWPGRQHSVCHRLWRLECLARHHQNAPAREKVLQTVASLEQRARSDLSRRWLAQVREGKGPPPRSSGTRIVRSPNDLKPAAR